MTMDDTAPEVESICAAQAAADHEMADAIDQQDAASKAAEEQLRKEVRKDYVPKSESLPNEVGLGD